MKVLIAYDGSGYAHNALSDLRRAGLPDNADVLMISVSEVWLPPQTENSGDDICLDEDAVDYFRKHSEQMERNLGESREILIEAKEELKKQFPNWAIQTESIAGSPAQTILQKAATFVPDLIVVGPRGLSSDIGTGLGSVPQNVLSYSHFPVRIGRGNSERDAGQLRIAICFDGSACSLEAVKTVASRDWRRKTRVQAFCSDRSTYRTDSWKGVSANSGRTGRQNERRRTLGQNLSRRSIRYTWNFISDGFCAYL